MSTRHDAPSRRAKVPFRLLVLAGIAAGCAGGHEAHPAPMAQIVAPSVDSSPAPPPAVSDVANADLGASVGDADPVRQYRFGRAREV